MSRRTKILATLGPASDEPQEIEALLRAGADAVRLNLSHGTLEGHLERMRMVRELEAVLGRPVAVLADLPGPKVRAGSFPEGGVMLEPGALVTLVADEGPSTATRLTVDYEWLAEDVQPGDRLVVGDGAIMLEALTVGDHQVEAAVRSGGLIQGRPGVSIPSERLRLTSPTDDDLILAAAAAAAGVDFVAVSFVRTAQDLDLVREVVAPWGTRLVAKIETPGAIEHLDAICERADAVMVARGDLGIECPLEDVPHLQKHIIRTCVEAGVPVITATQMLESMISAPLPTRAEVSDVANAVFDGTDAVMLSGETAIGRHPPLVVSTMAQVAARAEQQADYARWATRLGHVQRRSWPDGPERITYAITHAAWQAASDLEAAAILCCTRTGRTARAMARFRPEAQLLGLSPDRATVRSLCLTWGVRPVQVEMYDTKDDLVWFSVERAVHAGHVHPGDHVVVLAGAPDRPTGAATDVVRIVRID
jgi:pyruvate kinase